MIRFRKFLFLIIFFLVLSFSACRQPVNQPDTKIKVITTIAPLYSFTKNIAGDTAIVENLLPSGIDPHEYSLSPVDVKKIAEADVFVKNGVNLESWLDKLVVQELVEDSNDNFIIVDTSTGIPIINNDPHIWLAPGNAIIQVNNIMNALVKADPDNSETYIKNTSEYINRLNSLHRDIINRTGAWKKKEFVAFHRAFIYFEKDYGLTQVAAIQKLPGQQPAPKHISNVINTIKEKNIKAIFSDPMASHKIVNTIAGDLNLRVYSLDTLETGELSGEWYESRMRANLSVLEKALNGENE